MGRTPRDMGHVRETEGEVLVAGTIPGRASVCDDLRKLSDALHSPTWDELHPMYPPTVHFKVESWPRLLPYALWEIRTTHSSVTGYMPVELMFGQKPIMPMERSISSWAIVGWIKGHFCNFAIIL